MSKSDFMHKMALLSHFIKYFYIGKKTKDKDLADQMKMQIKRILKETRPIVKKSHKALELVPTSALFLFIK